MNLRKFGYHTQRAFIPIPMLIILLVIAALGGGLVGFFMGQGIQGIAITVSVTIIIVMVTLNLPGVITWVNSFKKGGRRK